MYSDRTMRRLMVIVAVVMVIGLVLSAVRFGY